MHSHAETVAAEMESDSELIMGAWDRISSGPFYWNTMDQVLFFALIMLALEILNFLCNHSGGTKKKNRVVSSKFSFASVGR